MRLNLPGNWQVIRFESGKYYQNFDEELNYVFVCFFWLDRQLWEALLWKCNGDSDVEVIVVYFSVRKLELDIWLLYVTV